MVDSAKNIWADGPASAPSNPPKVKIRAWGTYVENALLGAAAGASIYDSKADMVADTSQAANAMAWVLGDATAANNGVYQFNGTSTWTRLGDLPYSYIAAANAGAGTANAIVASTSIPIPAADGGALIALPIVVDNTGTVTVAFNGGTALTIKTSSGNDIAVGGLTAGMIVAGYVSGSTFRLLSDQASAAVLAAAEAAQTAAEAAAAGVNLPSIETGDAGKVLTVKTDESGYDLLPASGSHVFDTQDDADGATIGSGVTHASTVGFAAIDDGGDAIYALGSTDPTMPGQWSPADGRFAEIIPAARYKPSPFGILPEDTGAAALTNDVFDWMTRRRGGGIVELLPEDYYITNTITPLSGCGLIGAGGAGQYPTPDKVTSSNFLTTEKTRLAAQSGFADQYIVLVQPGNSVPYGMQGVRLEGLFIDCANIAQRGLGWISVKNSAVRDVMVFRPTAYGIAEDVLSTANATTEGNNATQFNSWKDVTVWAADVSSTAVGIFLNGTTTNNVNQNTRSNIKVVHYNGTGIYLANSDTDYWTGTYTTALGSGYGLYLGASNTDAVLTARNNTFLGAQFSISGGTGGGVLAAAGTSGSSNGNLILGYSMGNGSPLPVVQSGATLSILTDTGRYFINGKEVIGSDASVYGGRKNISVPAGGAVTAVQNGTLFDNTSAAAAASFTLPTPVKGMRYGFMVLNAVGINVVAASGSAIRIGASVSSTNRKAASTTVGDVLWLVATSSNAWTAENPALGGWTLS